MFKIAICLTLGIAIGYGYGWKDAQTNTKHVAERVVDRIGGDNKANFSGDIDANMTKNEGR